MAKPQGLLQRLMSTPDLPAIVPRLEPEILHRVIQACGLEDCAEFVALATPEQLARVLDADIWRAPTAGVDEAFDPDRFAVWIAVLMESGAQAAAEKLVGLDVDVVIAGLSHHLAAFDSAAVSSYTTLDGEHVPGRTMPDRLTCEVGGYRIEATRTSAWDTIVDLLTCLEAEHPEYFHRVMRECVRLSSGPREADGFHHLLDDRGQDMFDLASDRDVRREQRGYLEAAQARAFLQEGRAVRLDGERPPQSAIARAYFRGIEATAANTEKRDEPRAASEESGSGAVPRETEAVAAILELLEEEGLLTSRPRALLGAGDDHSSGLASIRAHAASHPEAEEQLAYVANALLAGCAVERRSFTAREASDCAIATANLGLEHWPPQWAERDAITAFQVGWTILHREVCLYTAERLSEILGGLECGDRDIQLRLDGLRRGLRQHLRDSQPWRSGEALEVILFLDGPSWAALRGLIAECPVVHAALHASRRGSHAVNPNEFEFMSRGDQIVAVREFIAELPSRLKS